MKEVLAEAKGLIEVEMLRQEQTLDSFHSKIKVHCAELLAGLPVAQLPGYESGNNSLLLSKVDLTEFQKKSVYYPFDNFPIVTVIDGLKPADNLSIHLVNTPDNTSLRIRANTGARMDLLVSEFGVDILVYPSVGPHARLPLPGLSTMLNRAAASVEIFDFLDNFLQEQTNAIIQSNSATSL